MLVLNICDAYEVISISENWSQLYTIPWLRCMVEIAIAGVDPVVRKVIEDHQIAGKCFFGRNLGPQFGLLVNAVWQIYSELRINKKSVTGAVNSTWSLATKYVRGSYQFSRRLHQVCTGNTSKSWIRKVIGCSRSFVIINF